MRLVTFQSFEALEFLLKNKYLVCDEKFINLPKYAFAYNWVAQSMNKCIKNDVGAKYPIWAWVKCYNGICPLKRKGEPIKGFDVKITFVKNKDDIFVTDFRRYAFVLNNTYIPNSIQNKNNFDLLLEKYNIISEDLSAYVRPDKYDSCRTDKQFIDVCTIIRKSFDRCITNDSDILQGCVWKIDLDDIVSIEILHDKNYKYGSLNYIRRNGKLKDFKDEFYQCLK